MKFKKSALSWALFTLLLLFILMLPNLAQGYVKNFPGVPATVKNFILPVIQIVFIIAVVVGIIKVATSLISGSFNSTSNLAFLLIACSLSPISKSKAALSVASLSIPSQGICKALLPIEYFNEWSNCTTVFTPDPGWSGEYPSCSITVSLTSCASTPVVSFQGNCYPDDEDIVVGKIVVYDGSTPVSVYEVRVEMGSVLVIFIEEF